MKLLSASLLLASSYAAAQTIVEEESFGYGPPRAPGTTSVPGWSLIGDGQDIQLLSDKVILTPPYPGNKRGAIWADHTTAIFEWTADFEFRASGGERPGGNLQLWYAKNGQSIVGTSSIYTVGKFDGLAIVIDSHGGSSGMIRGFLNDGTTDYQSRHPSVDSLAFGHCEYSYRNLGRPSRLQVKQLRSNFEVRIDDKLCFATRKVSLPANQNWGITAATSENPDSFEVFKFVVTHDGPATYPKPPSNPQQPISNNRNPGSNSNQSPDDSTKDVPASSITGAEAQFADLHNRLQAQNGIINALFHEFQDFRAVQGVRHDDIARGLPSKQIMENIEKRLQNMELMVQNLKHAFEMTDHKGQFRALNDKLAKSHEHLTDKLPTAFTDAISSSSPRIGFLLIVVILLQIALAFSYVVYKRRRANSPKKLL